MINAPFDFGRGRLAFNQHRWVQLPYGVLMECKKCGSQITDDKKFCNRSCAVSYNNTGLRRHGNKPTNKFCLQCNVSVNGIKFCGKVCKLLYHENKIIENLLSTGQDTSYNHKRAKKYLIKIHEGKCQVCGLAEWLGQKMPLVLDHMDGNSDNGKLDNLRVICNNCDALTDTYKSKNKGNGRAFRRKRYVEGKSY